MFQSRKSNWRKKENLWNHFSISNHCWSRKSIYIIVADFVDEHDWHFHLNALLLLLLFLKLDVWVDSTIPDVIQTIYFHWTLALASSIYNNIRWIFLSTEVCYILIVPNCKACVAVINLLYIWNLIFLYQQYWFSYFSWANWVLAMMHMFHVQSQLTRMTVTQILPQSNKPSILYHYITRCGLVSFLTMVYTRK